LENLFSLQGLETLLRTHTLLTIAIIATLLAIALIAYLWEHVCYFTMRAWHGLPVIGTVSRLSATPGYMKDGWPSVESDICSDYKTYYDKYDRDSSLYRKSKDYLAKVGEAGRRPIPSWVLGLAVILLIVEAVGFGFVLGPFVNSSASANQMAMLAWSVAFLLALISGGFAHFAGHDMHYNSLVKKAHAWWSRDSKGPQRPSSLKQLKSLHLEDSFNDDDQPDYQQIMARIHADHDVTQKKKVIYGFFAVIIVLAIAAFWIRAYTLESIETDMVAQLSSSAAPASAPASPFDLPDESKSVNEQSDNQAVQDKMDAIRHASLVTYIVLSVVYIAIQCLMLWLSVVYGFSGVHSKEAWKNTHRFNSADEFERWHANQRARIAGHADHKLRLLQQKRSSKHTAIAEEQDALATEQVGSRNFLSFVLLSRQDSDRHAEKMASSRQVPAETRPSVAPVTQAQVAEVPVNTVNAQTAEVDAASFKDLTPFDDAQLNLAAKALKMPYETLLDIRAQQTVLKQLGMFGAQEPA
jgi:hypothetical protein